MSASLPVPSCRELPAKSIRSIRLLSFVVRIVLLGRFPSYAWLFLRSKTFAFCPNFCRGDYWFKCGRGDQTLKGFTVIMSLPSLFVRLNLMFSISLTAATLDSLFASEASHSRQWAVQSETAHWECGTPDRAVS